MIVPDAAQVLHDTFRQCDEAASTANAEVERLSLIIANLVDSATAYQRAGDGTFTVTFTDARAWRAAQYETVTRDAHSGRRRDPASYGHRYCRPST